MGPIWKFECMIANIKPVVPPTRQVARELVLDIFRIPTLPKLEAIASDFMWRFGIGMGLEMKQIAEQIPGGLNPKKSFTKLNNYRNMENGIRIEVVDLDAIIIQQSMERKPEGGSASPRSMK